MAKIIGYPYAKETYFPKSDRIVHHQQQQFGEKGEIILVDLPDEDRVERINSFKDEVGLKNILRNLIKLNDTEGLAALAYDEEKDAVDVSGIEAHNLSELGMVAEAASAAGAKALADFNKALGTNLTAEEFEKMVNEGTLMDYLKGLNTPSETKESEATE